MNLFDGLAKMVFNTVTATMGYTATWTPKAGGPAQIAKVLYKGPTEKEKLAGVDFDPEGLKMEYSFGDFVGLKQAVDNSAKEKVRIYGTGTSDLVSLADDFSQEDFDALYFQMGGLASDVLECYVTNVNELWDGKTCEAMLKLK